MRNPLNPPPDAEAAHEEREHFFGSAKVIAGLTLGSRVLGMVRDMAIASLGATRLTDAFVLAFQIPNLFRRLFGEGALSGAFVPVFTETAESRGLEKASRLLGNAMGLLAAFLTSLMVVVQAGLLVWMLLIPPDATGRAGEREFLLELTAIMLPFMVTICMLALGSAALNCRGRFAYPAFAPVILNVVLIAAAWGLAPMMQDVQGKLYLISASVTAAGILQLIGVFWLLRRVGLGIKPRLRPVEPGIKPMLGLMAPMLLGLGFLQISPLFDSLIMWVLTATPEAQTLGIGPWTLQRPLESGSLMQVYTARRLYQFPMGVLAISLAVAVFPLLSRYAARGDTVSLGKSLNRAIRLSLMEGTAAGAALFVLAEPITQLIFHRGDFTMVHVSGSAHVLRMYVLGMWAYCSYQIFSRAFFAIKQPKTPMKVSAWLVLVNMILVLAMVWRLGLGAFGLATAITASGSTLILAALLRRRVGQEFGWRGIALSLVRTGIATAAMVGILYWLLDLLGSRPAWTIVALCVPAGAATFVGTAMLMRSPELGEFMAAVKKSPGPAVDSEASD